MSGYIPKGMVEKEYRWEWIHLQLYRILQENLPDELGQVLRDLISYQEIQIHTLENIAYSYGLTLPTPSNVSYEIYDNIYQIIEELYEREYQLLQEYNSYIHYFIPSPAHAPLHLHALYQMQQWQVNHLIQLKKALDELKKENGDQNQGHYKNRIKYDRKRQQMNIPHETIPHVDIPHVEPDVDVPHNPHGISGYLLEEGYELQKVTGNLTFPTDVTFDDKGNMYVSLSGFAYGTPPGEGEIIKIDSKGESSKVAGGFKGPVTSVEWYKGCLYVAEGARGAENGQQGCGRIIKVHPEGQKETIVKGLMSCGDHFTGDIVIGPNDKLYFSVGTATNSGVVGTDNLPWLKRNRYFHDVPTRDLVLNQNTYVTENPLTNDADYSVTGAYTPYGTANKEGEKVSGQLKANGVIYCCDLNGEHLQLVADGFRNPFGLRFSPFDGKLYATDNGADPRGSRPIQHDWDNFWEVDMQGGWHGWPDFFSGLPVILPHFHVEGSVYPTFLIRHHPVVAGQPLTRFKHHSTSNKFDFSINPKFGHEGEVFVAQTGNIGWGHHKEIYGFKVVRVHLQTGQIRDFLVNPNGDENKSGPIRPVAVKFSASGKELYVVDFGILGGYGQKPQPETGAVWKIVRQE